MRKHSVNLWIAAVVLALVASAASAQAYRDFYKLGHPATSFSSSPATTLPELKSHFVAYRSDLQAVLEMSGWPGDSNTLFDAVANAEAGGATVTARAIPRGETFHWMAYRKDGNPAIRRNARWAGNAPFPAWQIQFVSDGAVHTFIVPQACLNLAYYGEPIPVDAPGAPKVPGVPGAAPMTAPGAAAPDAGAPATAPAPAPAPAPMTAPEDEMAEGETPGEMPAAAAPAGGEDAPMAPAATTAPAEMRETMAPAGRDGAWTLRGWLARVDPDSDKWNGVDLIGLNEVEQFIITRGYGLGFDAEYHMNDRWGVDFGLMVVPNLEAHWMFDTATLWEMDVEDLDVITPFVGLSYHFTPDKRFDLWAGPYVSLWQFGEADLTTAQGYQFTLDPDNQVALGAAIGADLQLGSDSPWIGTAAVRYTPVAVEDSPIDIDLDPMIFSIGIGYRF